MSTANISNSYKPFYPAVLPAIEAINNTSAELLSEYKLWQLIDIHSNETKAPMQEAGIALGKDFSTTISQLRFTPTPIPMRIVESVYGQYRRYDQSYSLELVSPLERVTARLGRKATHYTVAVQNAWLREQAMRVKKSEQF